VYVASDDIVLAGRVVEANVVVSSVVAGRVVEANVVVASVVAGPVVEAKVVVASAGAWKNPMSANE